MEPGSAGGGFQGSKSLPQKGGEDPGQHIAAAAYRHAGVAGQVAVVPGAVGNAGPVPLQKDDGITGFGRFPAGGHPVSACRTEQPGKFPVMGCEDCGTGPSAQYIHMPGKQGYAIGIHHHRAAGLTQYGFQQGKGVFADAKPRTHEYRVHFRELFQNLGQGIHAEHSAAFRQRKNHGLVELHRLNGVDALGNAQIHKTGTGPEGTHGRKERSTCKAHTAAQQQELSKVPLVGVRSAPGQQGGNIGCSEFHHGNTSVGKGKGAVIPHTDGKTSFPDNRYSIWGQIHRRPPGKGHRAFSGRHSGECALSATG